MLVALVWDPKLVVWFPFVGVYLVVVRSLGHLCLVLLATAQKWTGGRALSGPRPTLVRIPGGGMALDIWRRGGRGKTQARSPVTSRAGRKADLSVWDGLVFLL